MARNILEEGIQLASFLGLHLLALALLAATACVAGRLASRRWIPAEELEGLERFAVSSALGLAILAHLAFVLGALGLLATGPLAASLVAVHLLGIPVWREAARDLRKWRRAWWRSAPRWLVPAVLLAATPLFVLALYPPTGFDETLYHLPYARAFAHAGSIPFLPEMRNPVFPQLNELLFTGMLLLAGPVGDPGDTATHLVQLLAALVTAALLIVWGRRSFSPLAGWMAGAAFLGNPIIVHLSGTAYVEPALTLFCAASVHALERWRETRGARWLALAGAFAASAAGIKYLGLFFVVAVLSAALPTALRERRVRELVVASAVVLAVLAPSYGRIVHHTGNPVFPFYPEVFGSSPWDIETALGPPRTVGERVAAYVSLPWDLLFDRGAVGRQPPYSPAYLLASPLLVFGMIRIPRVRLPLGMALAYSLVFPILPPDSRYLTLGLPMVSLALGGVLASLPLRRGFIAVLAVLLFLPGWAYGLYRIEKEGALPVTPRERDLYLAKEQPAYAALHHLNRLKGRDYTVYGVHAEHLKYYAEGTYLGDWNGPASFSRVLAALNDPDALHQCLRSLGVDYLLAMQDDGVSRLPDTPAWHRRFRRIYSDGKAEVWELEITGNSGVPPALAKSE